MTRKEIEQSLNWLTNTLVKVAKNCNVKIDGEVEAINANIDGVTAVNSIAFVTLAEAGQIDDVTAGEHLEVFSEWVEGVNYVVGNLRKYSDKLYRCISTHTSQADWTPDTAVSLWALTSDPEEEFPAWSQPVGAHDAYGEGDKVAHAEKRWTSDVDGNVWEPGVYGWTEWVEENGEENVV